MEAEMQSGAVQNTQLTDDHQPGPGRQNYGRGLYLLPAATPASRRGWRFDYQFNGRRKTLSLGVYPDVTVNAAMDAAGALRLQLADGMDPSKERRKMKRRPPGPGTAITGAAPVLATRDAAPGTFKDVAQRWYASKVETWSPSYAPKVLGRLKNHLYPVLGRRQVSEITPRDLLDACLRVADSGAKDTARRVCDIAGGVLGLAVIEGWATRDFSAEVLAHLPKYHSRNFAAITDPRGLAKLLNDIDNYSGTFVVKCALRLAPLLMLRPGELRQTLWSNVDLEHKLLIVPVDRLKLPPELREKAEDHVVPLSGQAVTILKSLLPLTYRTGAVFPGSGPKGRFISDNTLNKALRIMGYCTQTDMTAHGFRATARTMLVERLKFDKSYAEMQLAHVVPDLNGTAYNRADYEEDRERMMQAWADYLDELKAGKVTFKQKWLEKFTPTTYDCVDATAA